MKSSTGAHFIALDHVRALAAFIVVTWHFIHSSNGYPVPFAYVPTLFPLSILDEGHTGVALFLTLSGYLFAKLLDGKSINFKAFIWNRALRLLPLLVVVIVARGVVNSTSGQNILNYIYSIAKGFLLPTLPNGGWSITVEFHFYLILPILLWTMKRSAYGLFIIILSAIALRSFIFYEYNEVQTFAYWTIIGRIDQFALGMLAFKFRDHFYRRHTIALSTLLIFSILYWYFDLCGGFYESPSYPSPSPFWIVLPTIEGIAYCVGIAWYDSFFVCLQHKGALFIGLIGEYSYSIYLLHTFWVFQAAKFVNENIMNISNFYLACIWSFIFFILMMIPGYFSFRYIEAPFLKLRKRYID